MAHACVVSCVLARSCTGRTAGRRHAPAMMSGRESEADARVRRDGVPRLGSPAGPAHGRRRPARGPRNHLSGLERARGRRAHRHRRPRDRPGCERRRRRRSAARTRGGGPHRRAARGRRDASRRGGGGGLPRPFLGEIPVVPLPRADRRPAPGPGRATRPLVAAADRRRCARTGYGAPARRARLPCLHPDRDTAPRLRPHRPRSCMGAGRRPARLHDHRGRLPPTHGPDARRDDARGGAGRPDPHDGAPRGPAAPGGGAHCPVVGPLSRAGGVLQ